MSESRRVVEGTPRNTSKTSTYLQGLTRGMSVKTCETMPSNLTKGTDVPLVKICKYVDDFVVFVSVPSTTRLDSVAQSVRQVSEQCFSHLQFTLELRAGGFLQFLD